MNMSGQMSLKNRPAMEQRGFTLVEMMVTVGIGFILLSIAVGAYGNLRERTQVESAKESIVSVLQQARFRAVATGSDQVVAFDWAADSMTYLGQVTTFDVADLRGYKCSPSPVSNNSNTDNTFTFRNRGTVAFGGTNVGGGPPQNIQISSPASPSAFVVKVNSVTGRVAIVEGSTC